MIYITLTYCNPTIYKEQLNGWHQDDLLHLDINFSLYIVGLHAIIYFHSVLLTNKIQTQSSTLIFHMGDIKMICSTFLLIFLYIVWLHFIVYLHIYIYIYRERERERERETEIEREREWYMEHVLRYIYKIAIHS